MSEKRESGELRSVGGYSEIEHVGDFYFEQAPSGQEFLCVLLPGNAHWGKRVIGAAFARLPVTVGPDEPWQWDGNREKPTLSPSVWNHEHWHGFIRGGRYESC